MASVTKIPWSSPSVSSEEKKRSSLFELIRANAILIALSLTAFLLHLATSTRYGFFFDEFYYVDAGKHLAFGYVDFPAFVGLLAAFSHAVLGDSLMAYRVFPAIASAFIVLLAGLITRELGGGNFAQFLVSLAVLISPEVLWLNSTLTTGTFDPLWWLLATYILLYLIKREKPQLWLLFGLVVGIGLTNKLTILSFGFAVVLGLLLTPQRKYLFNKWAYMGGAIALAFLIPYVLWNAANDWASLEFYKSYNSVHGSPVDVFGFFYQQAFMVSPILLPLWLAGLYCMFFNQAMRPYRAFGWIYIILYVLFTITRAHFYFLAPAYVILMAAGAMGLENLTRKRWRWVKPTYVVLVLMVGMLMMSYAIPVLPLQTLVGMYARAGGHTGIQLEKAANSPQLPDGYAAEMGWESMTATVAEVYHSLPRDEQATACILASNYGEAGAINYYGSQYHLPQAISGHNMYYLWGPGNCTGDVVVSIGYPLPLLQGTFGNVVQASTSICQYCIPMFNHLPVYVARHIKIPMKAAWIKFKHYD
jgi:hypothetical protein